MYLKKPAKINSKNANMQMKINKAHEVLNKLSKYNKMLDNTPDEDTFDLISNSIVVNYERYCEVVKDILDSIAVKENINNLSDKRGLGELIRTTASKIGINSSTFNVIRKLTLRNEVVHDYLNSEYYDNKLVIRVSNDLSEYKKYIQAIEKYLKLNKMI